MSKRIGVQETRSTQVPMSAEHKTLSDIPADVQEKALKIYEKNKDICDMLRDGPHCADRDLALVVMIAAGVV